MSERASQRKESAPLFEDRVGRGVRVGRYDETLLLLLLELLLLLRDRRRFSTLGERRLALLRLPLLSERRLRCLLRLRLRLRLRLPLFSRRWRCRRLLCFLRREDDLCFRRRRLRPRECSQASAAAAVGAAAWTAGAAAGAAVGAGAGAAGGTHGNAGSINETPSSDAANAAEVATAPAPAAAAARAFSAAQWLRSATTAVRDGEAPPSAAADADARDAASAARRCAAHAASSRWRRLSASTAATVLIRKRDMRL